MKIGNVLNDFTSPGGEAFVARAIAAQLGACRFERSSKAWEGSRGLKLAVRAAQSFYNWEAVQAFREWALYEKPDVVLFHNLFPVLSPGVVEEAWRLGIPAVVYLHSYRYLCANGFFLNHGEPCERCIHGNFWPAAATASWRDSHMLSAWYGAILSTLRPRGFFERVDRFIAISDFVRGKYIEAGVAPEKISVLRHFYDASAIEPRHDDDGYVLFAGRLSAEKGVRTLLEAARELPDISFRIAGDGPFAAEARELVARHRLGNVELWGFVDETQLSRLYAAARFVVVPSEWHEALGMVVLEAFAHGKAVLGSRMGALPELIEPRRTGDLFRARDPRELAARIELMFQHADETRAWGRRAREWVELHASPEVWKSQMERILREVTASVSTRNV